ncbi:MBL fold metallo-hydrolase [Marinobacter hydrocarbonoclasticus]|nr:MBL fold metallo-hydrolase [Marinobacter nauticus]
MSVKPSVVALSLSLALSLPVVADGLVGIEDYQGKPASEHTVKANAELAKRLPWKDASAFERTQRGLIAEFGSHAAGELKNKFNYMAAMNLKELPPTVNPSLWRQGMLNYAAGGLYEVTDGVYQVRGADLSNMTIYRSDNGYIIHDPLLSDKAAAAAWDFAKQHLPAINGEHRITGVIYSHMHVDHFGGSRGIIDEQFDGPILAPDGFLKELADENMIGGNAMGRRAQYQYGTTLPNSTEGIVDNALGLGTSDGNVTLVAPTEEVGERERWVTIDGLEMLLINMPGAEAPAEMVVYLPKYRSLNTAELTYDGQHNIYTFRGAKVRDALVWTKYLTELKFRFVDSGKVDNIHAAHSAPVWGQAEISDYMTLQRDNYGFVHNQSMRLANHGVTIHDVGRAIEEIVPQSQFDTWHTNGYHGSYSHNARAVVNLYLGYHDMNPVNVNPLTSHDKACTYVAAAGAKTLVAAGQAHFDAGRYQQASQLLNDVVTCDPDNGKARHLLADSYEQQGYQAETMAWRNSYLQGAYELRTGHVADSLKTASVDIIANTPTGMMLDYLAVRLNGPKAEAAGLDFNFQLIHPDLNEIYYGEVSNANMANIQIAEAVEADLTVTLTKAELTSVLLGQATLAEVAKIEGDAALLAQLKSVLDTFESDFEIVPLPTSKG